MPISLPADRPAELSDVVVLEVYATLHDDGEEPEEMEAESLEEQNE